MNGWEFLGLRPDADERDIKRAYARLLRGVRPDQDAEGFQQLHNAYQWALAQRAYGNNEGEESTGEPTATRMAEQAEPVEHPAANAVESASVLPVSIESAELAAFQDELLATAATGDAEAVQALLDAQPAFWSLSVKHEFAGGLIHRLFHDEPAMPRQCFEALLAFFDLDHVHSGIDPLYLAHLRRRLHLAWELRRINHDALAARLREPSAAKPRRETDPRHFPRYLSRLSQPLRWRDAFGWMLWTPSHSSRTGHFIARLDGGYIDALPDALDRPHMVFWLRANDDETPSLPRLAMDLANWLAWTLRIVAAAALLGLLVQATTKTATVTRSGPEVFAGVALAACLLWLVYLLWKITLQWQCLPQDPNERWRWLRVAFIPILATSAWSLLHSSIKFAPIVIALFALTIAALRYRRRAGLGEAQFETWWLLLLYPVSKIATAMGDLLLIALIGCTAITLGIWATDLWHHHAALRRPAPAQPERLES